jgi:two-component system OmpR family sensor kinase
MTEVVRKAIRLPLRLRITAAATVSLAVILVTLSLFVYGRLHAELVRALDSGLQARAAAVAGALGQASPLNQVIADGPDARLASATQIMTPAGRVLAHAGAALPALPGRFLRDLSAPAFRQIPGQDKAGVLRLYALPVNEGRPLLVVVATSLTGLNETMGSLQLLLLVGDPTALAFASLVAWLMIGAALRPVERMRREAATISVTDAARRLPVPATHDEVARLGETLNALLDRLHGALDRERRLLDDASHELRTPLSALKAELDLALSRERSAAELQVALQSASEETNRLARLAQDLLVLSRSREAGLPILRVSTALGDLIDRACARHQPGAAQADCRIVCEVPDTEILADPMRLTQAVDNLLDNAVRYSCGGGTIRLRAEVTPAAVTITVTNPGPGFPAQVMDRAFEPFVSGSHLGVAGRELRPGREHRAEPGHEDAAPDEPGAGLGLAIVQAVARAHGGWATARNVPDGASVAMTLMRGPAMGSVNGQPTTGHPAEASAHPASFGRWPGS